MEVEFARSITVDDGVDGGSSVDLRSSSIPACCLNKANNARQTYVRSHFCGTFG